MLRILTLAVALLFAVAASAQDVTAPPSAPPGATEASLFPALIEHSLHYADLHDGQLSGEGAQFLREVGQKSHFVVLGEEHGNSGISDFAAAYWRELNSVGYEYLAIEVDRFLAARAEAEFRGGGIEQWGRYLAAHGGAAGAPFIGWRPEAELLNLVVASTRRQPAIWGLDQVYNGSAPARLREIANGARDRRARELAARLAGQGEANWNHSWFTSIDLREFENLRGFLNGRRDRRWAEMTDALSQSWRIYQPFSGGVGEPYLANLERETLMKRSFIRYYEAAMRAHGSLPRVMLKVGANHATRGATPTWVQGLGGFVSEYAVSRGIDATTFLVLCGPDGWLAVGATPTDCDEDSRFPPFLMEYIDRERLTIMDLRVWRLRPQRWQNDLPAEFHAVIGSTDILVVVPNGAASEYLPILRRGVRENGAPLGR